MTGIYQCREIVFPGQFIFRTRGPRKFAQGHSVSGRPITPPNGSVGRKCYLHNKTICAGSAKYWNSVLTYCTSGRSSRICNCLKMSKPKIAINHRSQSLNLPGNTQAGSKSGWRTLEIRIFMELKLIAMIQIWHIIPNNLSEEWILCRF